jgi:vacuolar-type H+-ATPase subunit H
MKAMAPQRSRRLRLLESLRRTMNEILTDRVHRLAQKRGHGAPQNTSSIYASATEEAPELLDQLFFVHRKVGEEMGEKIDPNTPDRLDENQRKAMLSAVRAAVHRSREILESRTE